MSLGIFSFDFAALIRSLENRIDSGSAEVAPLDETLENIENALEKMARDATAAAEALISAVLNSAVTPVIAAAEKTPPANHVQKAPATRAGAVKLDEETRKEIERQIKSLQTSVIHNYKTTDIIDEAVSLNSVANFPKPNGREKADRKAEAFENERKRDERKLEMLRDELKRAVLKNNSSV